MVGIGEIAAGITIFDTSLTAAKYFKKLSRKYFSKKSQPLDRFFNQDVAIVCSSLYAPKEDKEKGLYTLQKKLPNKDGVVATKNIGSGYSVLGIDDAFGLVKLAIALIQRDAKISLLIDECGKEFKKDNLCLIGGKSSNVIARELYSECLSSKYQFYSEESGMEIHGKNFKGGEYGHILSMRNPWNPQKSILWLAGLGPLGTGAAVHFTINYFIDSAPAELSKHENWILFIKGNRDRNQKIVGEVNQIGHYILP